MSGYAVTAEFYDLLQGAEFTRTAGRLLDRWLGSPRVGVLDVGAGTGLATVLLGRRCAVTVHAVEPSASMRSILLSRLAGRPDLLDRVRVHARPAARLGLSRAADFAICLNTMGTLDAVSRAEGLDALAAAMVRGGVLLVQRPPCAPPPARVDLPAWNLGGDTYAGEVTCTPAGPGRVTWRFTYRVSRSGALVRTSAEEFDGYVVPAADFDAELRRAGFAPMDADEPDVVIARRS